MDLKETVVIAGNEFAVELLFPELFAKTNIACVNIPKTVKSLPEKCFEHCDRLQDIHFSPECRVAVFGKCCFKGCGFNAFTIPDSVLSIEDKCFDGCRNLCKVEIQKTSALTKLGRMAFRGCNIHDLFLPNQLNIDDIDFVFLGVNGFSVSSRDFELKTTASFRRIVGD